MHHGIIRKIVIQQFENLKLLTVATKEKEKAKNETRLWYVLCNYRNEKDD